ncbi:hypothetical protein [Flaviflexus equikiangi]|uniref:Tetratricopeptide repeat protein n=1 Tax=Flaviflexus equikiangi TaxID=2758573 RepID=A0ABS2THC4_9ACTO|nr:hypothetical protein [Flaviflexus equikiangi]MBM9434052.1 hypothetical protein [Flaviflexus equikiangi]
MKAYHGATAVVGTLIVALAVWAGLIWGSMWLGRAAYERGDYEQAIDLYGTAERISPFDRWRPDFGQGTGLLAQGDLSGIAKLEQALDTVPTAEVVDGVKDPNSYECLVRANLYLGYSEAGRDEEAQAVIETCPNPSPSEGESGEPEEPEGTEEPPDPQQEELAERDREAREQRQNDQEWGRGGGSGQNW